MAIVHGQSRRLQVSDQRVQRLALGAVVWSALMVPLTVVMSLVSEGNRRLAGLDGLPLTGLGWALLVVPVPLALVAWRWGQDSRTALVVPALGLDLGIIALGASPALLFAPAAMAVTVAALARRD